MISGSIILTLIVVAIVLYIVYRIVEWLPLPPAIGQYKWIIYVIIGIIVIIWLLGLVGIRIP